MKTGLITVSWGIEAVLVFMLAFAVKETSFRRTGLGLLLVCVGKIAALDFWGLQIRDKYITLIAIAKRQINRVPVINGTNHDEGRLIAAFIYDLSGAPLQASGYEAGLEIVS